MGKILNFVKQIVEFVRKVSADPRIPDRDKALVFVCLALVISPVDLIPDWIPIIGVLDDIVIIAIVLDYLFEVLDQDILLTHYPFGMKSFTRIRRMSRFISRMTPGFVKSMIWKYERSPYK